MLHVRSYPNVQMFEKKISSSKAITMSTTATRLTVNGSGCGASEIKFKQMRFLITDRPTEATLDRYIEELNKNKVKEVVRVCNPTYDAHRLEDLGIQVNDWSYADGQAPPTDVLNKWLHLVKHRFRESPDSCIAVHCVAGLGRAPVLVAIALMEMGMKFEEAVDLIRTKRRGALSQKQLDFLEHYRAKSRLADRQKEAMCSIQ